MTSPYTDQRLTTAREHEIRTLDLTPLMNDLSAARLSGYLATLLAEVDRLRAVLSEIRHLHKDSPMGPCPVCIDADAAAAGGDGLVPYPCPTGRLAGAEDCDPPRVRAAIETGTGPCGHDDYHDPHEWADQPGVWCPGHGIAAVEEQQLAEACGKCKQPFDPADTRFDGHAQHRTSPYCRRCVDLCHDNEIADHRCVICA